MISLKRISPNDGLLFKTVRLRALRDAPRAFGSTYAKESLLADAEWEERALRWGSDPSVCYLAMDGAEACGIAGSFLDENDPTRAHLISMWTAPTYRRKGLGNLLVNEIIAWAADKGAHTLQLMVTSKNRSAILFYERLGFVMTGRTEPYPNDADEIEYEMVKPIRAGS
jgi:ribosomal protein S18 acetylase RimI-like enzyme